MNFHSEYGEDQWIHENLSLEANGFFVDLGCSHPERGSNTAWLRELGWRGLAVDGNPDYAAEWKPFENPGRVKFMSAVLASAPGQARFAVHENSQTSQLVAVGPDPVAGVLRVEERLAWTLPELLVHQQVPQVNVLNVDLEGAEFDVLSKLDLREWRPNVIIAEYSTQGRGEDYRVLRHLLDSGLYFAVHQTKANLIYAVRPLQRYWTGEAVPARPLPRQRIPESP